MLTPRYRFGLAAFGFGSDERLFAAGGRTNGAGYLASVETFDGTSWTLIAAMPDVRDSFSLVAINFNIQPSPPPLSLIHI
eukprot:3063611-Prymnesium_polylepis.1